MKQETKTVTIRIPQEVADWLISDGKYINQAIVESVQTLKKIRIVSEAELRGVFTPDEWKFFTDSLNGTMVTDDFRCNKQILIAHCEDSANLEYLDKKWNVDIEVLKEKIQKLHGANIDAIYARVESFWSGDNDLDEWAKF